jgi:hypothetical protein
MIPQLNCEITYEWLRSRGFRIERPQVSHTPHMSIVVDRSGDSFLEVSPSSSSPEWFCFFRNDMASRRCKFVFVRMVQTKPQLEKLFEAIAGKELPVEEFDLERFKVSLVEISRDCDRAWARHCDTTLRQDVSQRF